MAANSSSLGITPASESAVALTITIKRIAFLLVRLEKPQAGGAVRPPADRAPMAGFYPLVDRAPGESTLVGKIVQARCSAAFSAERKDSGCSSIIRWPASATSAWLAAASSAHCGTCQPARERTPASKCTG